MTTARLPPLAITALSPVAAGASFCRLAGVLWATVIVKATFQLVHGEPARLIAAEELVTSDRASGPSGSLTHARETVPHLLNVGVVLTGHACAPDGRAVPSMSVRLGVSRDRPVIDKTLHVFGARAVANPGAISPFQRMPLVYERSNGGAGTWENPVGTGGPGSRVLPNIVDPKDPHKVAGFGPISPQWAPRRALLRGMDPSSLEAPIWDVPAGFDWRFFQPAPADQQVDRLYGDEWIVLDGMDPALPRVQARLPQVSARARRSLRGANASSADGSIDLRADMLVIDADRRIASLIWRGRFAVESLEAVDRMSVLVGIEQPGCPVAWPVIEAPPAAPAETETQEFSLAAVLGAAVPFSGDRKSALDSAPPAARPQAQYTGTAAVDLRALFGAPVPFAAALATSALPATGRTESGAVLSTIEGMPALKSSPLPFAPPNPAAPSVVAVPSPAPTRATPMSTGTTDIHLAQLLKAANRFDPEEPARQPVSAPSPPVEPPPIMAPDPPLAAPPSVPVREPSLTSSPSAEEPTGKSNNPDGRLHVQQKLARGEALDGDDLTSANLSGLDLSGRSLVGCCLRAARLRGTKLSGADLSNAVLEEADLRGAQLDKATLTDASLRRANLECANLAACHGERTDLRDAQLRRANLADAKLPNARLNGATLREVQAPRLDIRGARLDGADLTGGCLRGAVARGAIFANALLDTCDLQRANLEDANLHRASTRRAMLAGTNMAGTVSSAPDE